MKLRALATITIIALHLFLPISVLAQSYGDGSFGDDVYNGSEASTPTPTITTTPTPTVSPTPIAVINTPAGDLPITGTTVTVIASIGSLLVALGLILWARNRRKSPA